MKLLQDSGQGLGLRYLARIFAFLLLTGALSAQETTPPSLVFEPDVMIPMRDGTKLAANIFRPKTAGRFPVILMRTPYGKPDEKWGDAKRYIPAGYAMVVDTSADSAKGTPIVLFNTGENDITETILSQLNSTAPADVTKADVKKDDKKDEKKDAKKESSK